MGSAFEFCIVTELEEAPAEALLEECVLEVQRLERLLTEFSADSWTAFLNQNAGQKAVTVPLEVYQLIQRCCDISRLTKGAFDISAGGLKKCYSFSNGPGLFPKPAILAEHLSKTGYEKIHLPAPNQVFLKLPGMHIGFGGIGKGFSADRVRALLHAKGVENGLINASGDLTAWGRRANGQAWKIGIAHPDQPDNMLLWLPVEHELCLATSGNYEQYFEQDGIRYGHTIDPRNGRPVAGIKSVTVVSPSAELSDALATAVTVLGLDDGMELLNRLPNTHGIMIDGGNQVFYSNHLEVNSVA